MSKEIFLNFPIQLLQGAFEDIRKVMQNIMHYAGYSHTLNLEAGSEEYLMTSAGNFLGINYRNPIQAFQHGRELFNNYPKNSPSAGIRNETLFDFYSNTKSANEIAVLLAFLAIKSILGPKPYVRCTNEYLTARMCGLVRISDSSSLMQGTLNGHFTRRKLDRIKFELKAHWGINIYARATRGFYVSIERIFTLEKLISEAENKRKKTIEATLKMREIQAIHKVLTRQKNIK